MYFKRTTTQLFNNAQKRVFKPNIEIDFQLIFGKVKINNRVFEIVDEDKQGIIQTLMHTKPHSIGPTYVIHEFHKKNYVIPFYSILNKRIRLPDNSYHKTRAIVLYNNSYISTVDDTYISSKNVTFDIQKCLKDFILHN